MMKRIVIFITAVLAAAGVASADFQYQQTTKITGGSLLSMMRMMGRFSSQARQGLEPITQSAYLKGNRMAHVGKDSTEIIDLDNETITHVDHAKRQYSVMTFEQMRKAMEDAAKQMQEKSKEQKTDQHWKPVSEAEQKNARQGRGAGSVELLFLGWSAG